MKFVVDRAELVRAVTLTARSPDSAVPLYAASSGDGIAFIGDDGATRVTTIVSCRVDDATGPGRVQRLPDRKFPAVCRHLPKGEVSVEVSDHCWTFTVEGMTTVKVPTRPPDGFALLEPLPTVGVLSRDFAAAVKRVRAAAAPSTSLASVRLESSGDRLRVVATDRYRLHLAEVKAENLTLGWCPLLPLGAAAAVAALTGPGITLRAGDGQVEFTNGETTVRARLLTDPFPDYAPLLRIDPQVAAFVSPKALLAAVTDASSILADDSDRCYLTFRPDSALIDVEAISPQTDMQFRTYVEATEITGVEMTVAVVPRRFVAALQSARGRNQVEIDLHGEFERVIFRNPGARVPFAVVMPLR